MRIRLLFLLFLCCCTAQASTVTSDAYIQSLPKPVFKSGHTLPRLTSWTYSPVSSNTGVVLARDWGYALTLDVQNKTVAQNTNENTTGSGYIALANSDPNTYKIAVVMMRTLQPADTTGAWVTNAAGYYLDAAGNTSVDPPASPVLSPEAPASYWQAWAATNVSRLAAIQSLVPVAYPLNGDEVALDVPSSALKLSVWPADPRVAASRGSKSWSQYISECKSNQLSYLKAAVNAACPSRDLYVFYKSFAEGPRTFLGGGVEWEPDWGWKSECLNSVIDIPNFEAYFWTTNAQQHGITGNNYTLLSCFTSSVGYNIALGKPLNYSWVSAGWHDDPAAHPEKFMDIPTYFGLLKCLYTAGMIGASAGYFSPAVDSAFDEVSPPHWLQQFIALSHVHALFSHLESYLRSGSLLPGSGGHQHSSDYPRYEFTNVAADANCHVLARKLDSADDWIITAWNAWGSDRPVTVTIPTLGQVTLTAATTGNVYRATVATGPQLVNMLGQIPSELHSSAATLRVNSIRGR